jgi:hypothetical protein
LNVLFIRSDLPESPEVLLLAGMLADSDVPLGWIPTPEVIVCKLIKIWAWVAEHGHRDSDSLDYWIPSPLVASLEKQFACSGLLAAMCNPHIDWCRQDSVSSRMAFCRFAEWNGEDAMKRRGDSARARNSRTRSRSRMGIAARGAHQNSDESAHKTVPKAHAKRDARHTLRAPSIDVDVDVLKDNRFKQTSTSNDQEQPPATPDEVFAKIRMALRSASDADDDQVAKDRITAWKASVVIADRLSHAFIDQVLASIAKSRPRRPYAYLWAAIDRKLERDGMDAKRLFAAVSVPPGLVDPEGAALRLDKPAPAVRKAISSVPLEEQRAAARAALANEPDAKQLYEAARMAMLAGEQPVATVDWPHAKQPVGD